MNEVIVEVVDKSPQQKNYIVDKVSLVVKEATSLQVVDDESYIKAGEILLSIKDAVDQVEGFWETTRKSSYAAWKSICAKEKEMKKPLESAEKVLKAGIGAYVMIKQDERRKLEAEAKETYGVEIVLDANTPKVQGISTSTDYEVIVTDINQVPVMFNGVQICNVDVSAVKKLAKMMKGKLVIPGLKINETKIVRASNK